VNSEKDTLCHLLGIEFMPRIKDLPDQSLFKLDRHQKYGELDCLFDETVPRDLNQRTMGPDGACGRLPEESGGTT
jgi:TnpA family transposase